MAALAAVAVVVLRVVIPVMKWMLIATFVVGFGVFYLFISMCLGGGALGKATR